MSEHDDNLYHRGLALDLATMLDRRRVLKIAAGAGVLALAGCASSKGTVTSPASSTTTSSAATAAGCATLPEETAGPFPGNGSNGPDILTQSGVVRSDIRTSIGSASGTAAGGPADRHPHAAAGRQLLRAVQRCGGLPLARRP